MNACPTPPTPGGSNVPRAKTIWTSGHGAAAAEGGLIAGLSSRESASDAKTNRRMDERLMTLMTTPKVSGVPDTGGADPSSAGFIIPPRLVRKTHDFL